MPVPFSDKSGNWSPVAETGGLWHRGSAWAGRTGAEDGLEWTPGQLPTDPRPAESQRNAFPSSPTSSFTSPLPSPGAIMPQLPGSLCPGVPPPSALKPCLGTQMSPFLPLPPPSDTDCLLCWSVECRGLSEKDTYNFAHSFRVFWNLWKPSPPLPI